MEMQYFKSVWGDIRNSPGWFGKLCLLSLLNLIPIFGQIVLFGYLFGWAREIAWGTHEPMPAKIFSNEDGKFWRRGWFALVISFVFMLIPYAVMGFGNYWQGLGYAYSYFGGYVASNPAFVGLGGLLSFAGWLIAIVMAVLAWIGIMRMSIYDRLSSGFQFNKIWKMLRHDTTGVLKVFGMYLLVTFILGVIISVIIMVLVIVVVTAGIAGLVNAGYMVSPDTVQYMTEAQSLRIFMQFLASAGLVGFIAILIGTFCCSLVTVFIQTLVSRAMGYWTMQFDIPHWTGQDDPMPFELLEERQKSQQAPAQQQPFAQAAQANPASAQAVAPAPAPVPMAADAGEEEMPEIDYGGPIEVGAGFIMSPEEIAEAEAAAVNDAVEPAEASDGSTTEADASLAADAQGAHGVEDGQAGDPDVGENS